MASARRLVAGVDAGVVGLPIAVRQDPVLTSSGGRALLPSLCVSAAATVGLATKPVEQGSWAVLKPPLRARPGSGSRRRGRG